MVAKAKEGDHEAFRGLFEQTHARVFSYVLSHVSGRDNALDITQEAFIDIWKGLKSFRYRTDEEFYGFVFLVVKRKIYRYRKSRRLTILLDENAAEVAYEEPEHEDHRFLTRHIQSLATKYQELLRLRYWGGMKLAEAALVLGITENTAKVWHHRALKELKIKMENL